MQDTRHFQYGERVLHAGRPEWGTGLITGAQPAHHEGAACQRLTIRFDRAGLKTILTAAADIRAADEHAPPAKEAAAPADWLDETQVKDLPKIMASLPESATDPFSSLEARIRATMDLYRFGRTGASLIDWAAMQTGLKDPMSRFARPELEQFFERFAGARDQHLKGLLEDARRKQPGLIDAIVNSAPEAARPMVRKLAASR
jgi:hypothetical protein